MSTLWLVWSCISSTAVSLISFVSSFGQHIKKAEDGGAMAAHRLLRTVKRRLKRLKEGGCNVLIRPSTGYETQIGKKKAQAL